MPKKFTFHLSLHYQKNYTTNAPLLPTIKTKNQRPLNKTKNCILFILSTKKIQKYFKNPRMQCKLVHHTGIIRTTVKVSSFFYIKKLIVKFNNFSTNKIIKNIFKFYIYCFLTYHTFV